MTVRLSCSACGQQFAFDQNAGRSVRCPACNNVMATAGAARSDGIAARPGSPRPLPGRSRSEPPRRRRAVSSGGTIGLVLGVIALVLGVPALAISWVPFLCIIALICAGIGLLAGFIGTIVAIVQKGDGMVVSIAGGSINLVAVLVALLMTIVTGALMTVGDEAPETASAPVPEQNANAIAVPQPQPQPQPQPRPGGKQPAGAALAGWGQSIDPDNDCTFLERAGGLEVTVPATAHDLSAEMNKTNSPRAMQEVVGDFVVQVKVCGVLRPTTPGTVPGHLAYQAGGLLIWADERNYLRLERAGLQVNNRINTYAAFEQRANGLRGKSHTLRIPDQDTYLRLERRGDRFTPSVSSDGQNWRQFQAIEAALPERIQIGVAVINAAQQQLQVRFEELRIER